MAWRAARAKAAERQYVQLGGGYGRDAPRAGSFFAGLRERFPAARIYSMYVLTECKRAAEARERLAASTA
ncbi:MAG: hypothetical protein QOD37_1919 [Gaiellales bacterium]|nr:hypothetical protein [Gaiellales bacterium]